MIIACTGAGNSKPASVAKHFGDGQSRVRASGDGSRQELAKLSVGRTNTGGTKILLEVVPDFLDSHQVRDSDLDQGGEAQGDITKCSFSVVIPLLSVIMTVSRLGRHVDIPLALCPKVGLHGSVPLLPVGASEHGNHLVNSAGHGDISVGSQRSQQVNTTTDKQEKKKHLSANESTSVYS